MPGRVISVGLLQDAIDDLIILVVAAVLLQIVQADPPGGILRGEQLVKPLFLLPLADVQKEFQNQIAVVVKLALKNLDAFQALPQLFLLQMKGVGREGQLLIPAPVEYAHGAPGRQLFPKTP